MKKYIFFVFLIILSLGGIIYISSRKKEINNDQNMLYSAQFGKVVIKVDRYDYVLGENQTIVILKSIDNGKTFNALSNDTITVSMDAKFLFINDKDGFIISKPNLLENNKYLGFKFTHDGGVNFKDCIINYDNPNIDILTIKDVPYFEDNVLKFDALIYQLKDDFSGYEEVDLTFVSLDLGETWNLELSENERYNQIKNDINAEMKRYLNVIASHCNSDNAGGHLTHRDLVYNNGFDQEKLLDIDYNSYCKAYIEYKCVSDGIWDFNTTISCKNYTDKDYVDFGEPFKNKQ